VVDGEGGGEKKIEILMAMYCNWLKKMYLEITHELLTLIWCKCVRLQNNQIIWCVRKTKEKLSNYQ
jgi:hypothetical protein